MEIKNLSLVETETLVNELVNRVDSIIFMGVQEKDKFSHTYYRRWSGGDAVCLGLIELLKEIIKEYFLEKD